MSREKKKKQRGGVGLLRREAWNRIESTKGGGGSERRSGGDQWKRDTRARFEEYQFRKTLLLLECAYISLYV